jgi:hypothetical protein
LFLFSSFLLSAWFGVSGMYRLCGKEHLLVAQHLSIDMIFNLYYFTYVLRAHGYHKMFYSLSCARQVYYRSYMHHYFLLGMIQFYSLFFNLVPRFIGDYISSFGMPPCEQFDRTRPGLRVANRRRLVKDPGGLPLLLPHRVVVVNLSQSFGMHDEAKWSAILVSGIH